MAEGFRNQGGVTAEAADLQLVPAIRPRHFVVPDACRWVVPSERKHLPTQYGLSFIW